MEDWSGTVVETPEDFRRIVEQYGRPLLAIRIVDAKRAYVREVGDERQAYSLFINGKSRVFVRRE